MGVTRVQKSENSFWEAMSGQQRRGNSSDGDLGNENRWFCLKQALDCRMTAADIRVDAQGWIESPSMPLGDHAKNTVFERHFSGKSLCPFEELLKQDQVLKSRIAGDHASHLILDTAANRSAARLFSDLARRQEEQGDRLQQTIEVLKPKAGLFSAIDSAFILQVQPQIQLHGTPLVLGVAQSLFYIRPGLHTAGILSSSLGQKKIITDGIRLVTGHYGTDDPKIDCFNLIAAYQRGTDPITMHLLIAFTKVIIAFAKVLVFALPHGCYLVLPEVNHFLWGFREGLKKVKPQSVTSPGQFHNAEKAICP
ncbi:hypothetical protein B0H14DRAFT_2631692 [Mycena olivaceomarginata]|nr:hypothetical protein B0H14DRAFT_2631692 [Mycena olivaceomarginata]